MDIISQFNYIGIILNRYKINTKYYDKFQDFTLNVRDHFNKNHNTIHKARNELKEIKLDNIEIVVKSFKVPNLINRIAYTFFKDSKAKKSYEFSLKINKFTPTAISYIEFFENRLLSQSYFISEKFDYDFTIREPLLDDTFEKKEQILRAFARFTYELHENNIFHNDYSPGNILIKKDKNDFIFKIVDINRMKFYSLKDKDRAKNFSKLWASEEELKIISDEYLKYYDTNIDFTKEVCRFSQKNKNIKNFKKRLKGQKVTD